jgi:hypothetical protein
MTSRARSSRPASGDDAPERMARSAAGCRVRRRKLVAGNRVRSPSRRIMHCVRVIAATPSVSTRTRGASSSPARRERGTARRRASGGEGKPQAPSLRRALPTVSSEPVFGSTFEICIGGCAHFGDSAINWRSRAHWGKCTVTVIPVCFSDQLAAFRNPSRKARTRACSSSLRSGAWAKASLAASSASAS